MLLPRRYHETGGTVDLGLRESHAQARIGPFEIIEIFCLGCVTQCVSLLREAGLIEMAITKYSVPRFGFAVAQAALVLLSVFGFAAGASEPLDKTLPTEFQLEQIIAQPEILSACQAREAKDARKPQVKGISLFCWVGPSSEEREIALTSIYRSEFKIYLYVFSPSSSGKVEFREYKVDQAMAGVGRGRIQFPHLNLWKLKAEGGDKRASTNLLWIQQRKGAWVEVSMDQNVPLRKGIPVTIEPQQVWLSLGTITEDSKIEAIDQLSSDSLFVLQNLLQNHGLKSDRRTQFQTLLSVISEYRQSLRLGASGFPR